MCSYCFQENSKCIHLPETFTPMFHDPKLFVKTPIIATILYIYNSNSITSAATELEDPWVIYHTSSDHISVSEYAETDC